MAETKIPFATDSQLRTLEKLQNLLPVGWFLSFQQGSFHISESGLSQQEVRHIASALNSHQDLLDALHHVLAIENFHAIETVKYGDTPIIEIVKAAIQKAEADRP